MAIPDRRAIKIELIQLLASGPLRTPEIYTKLADQSQLTPIEKERQRTGRSFYEHEIRWAKQELVLEGVLSAVEDSERGLWKLAGDYFRGPDERADELVEKETYVEGGVTKVLVNRFERSGRARDACLQHFGYKCVVCGFDFELTYGAIGKKCIHVHHVIEISAVGEQYDLDPQNDLVPVCPNCHHIIHRRVPCFSIDEVKAMLRANTEAPAS